jgi:hypothetical protein
MDSKYQRTDEYVMYVSEKWIIKKSNLHIFRRLGTNRTVELHFQTYFFHIHKNKSRETVRVQNNKSM